MLESETHLNSHRTTALCVKPGWKWVEMSRNGFKLSEISPNSQKWVMNESEMGPDYQKWIRNGLPCEVMGVVPQGMYVHYMFFCIFKKALFQID